MTEPHKTDHPYAPDYAVPPGATLLETLESLHMDQRELAVRTGLAPKTINQIIKGKAPLSYETAIKLERATSVPARLWNNLESNYREALAWIEERERLSVDPDWIGRHAIPVRELIKRGLIPDPPDKMGLLKSVLDFFGVSSTSAWETYWLSPRVAFRKSECFKTRPGVCAAWLRIGELEARKVTCKPFIRSQFLDALREARSLTAKMPPKFAERLQARCAEAGVAVVYVPEMKGAPVSGATRWLAPDKALIELSLRYKRDDQFWFSFFHEAGHIIKGGKKDVHIDSGREGRDKAEEAANRFARDFLIPPSEARKLKCLDSHAAIVEFSKSIRIAPGIVVGRLQRDEIADYSHYNDLKRPLRWNWT